MVNAAGPHSSVIHEIAWKGAKVRDDSLITSKPVRVEVAVIPGSPGGESDKMPLVADLDLGIYMRYQYPGQVVIGGTEPECDTIHYLDNPDELDRSLTDEWTNYVYRAALRIPTLPIPGSSGTTGIVAMYDATPDWNPLYDKTALGGFFSMRGTSGNQFKNAPVVGKLLKAIIENSEVHDVHPVQLHLPRTNQTLDSKKFSRLRKGTDTSGTVLG